MGEVYRARDTKLNRDVALKVLPEIFALDADRLARFRREAQVLASLNHPHIAAIYGFEDQSDIHALVLELVEGPTLADRIAQGPLPIDEVLQIAKQIAEALEAAHEQGVIHRDLKPANIKLTASGKAKVLDFGLAKMLETEVSAASVSMSPTIGVQATYAGVILGTAAYMSPEQARGKALTQRTDIWSFGCVLYEMLTGRQAFEAGETVSDAVAAILTREPDWTLLPAGVPAGVRTVLRRCLQKSSDRRLHSIADARIELEDSSDALPPAASTIVAPARAVPLWRRGLPWAVAALAIAAAAAALWRAPSGSSAPRAVIKLELNLPQKLELFAGSTRSVAVSPDGTRVAFVGAINGSRQVYLRPLDKYEAVALRGSDGATACFFSPDGRSIALVTAAGVLKTIALSDGLTVTVTDNVNFLYGAAWLPDDRIVFVRSAALWQIPRTGGPATPLTMLGGAKNDALHAWPAALPDGKTLLFGVESGDVWRVDAMTLATGERRTIVERGSVPLYAASGHLVFLRDDQMFAAPFDASRVQVTGPAAPALDSQAALAPGVPIFDLSKSGTVVYSPSAAVSRLMWVTRQGIEAPVNDVLRTYTNPRIAPDGNRIAVQSGDLWTQDVARATYTHLASTDIQAGSFQIWTADGRKVMYRTSTGIHIRDADGGGDPLLIAGTTEWDYPASVTADGETLIFLRSSQETSFDIYELSLKDPLKLRTVLKTPAYEGGVQLSPDGHWLVYVSNDSGQNEIYLRPYHGADRRWPVSTQGGTQPKWNPNGKEIFYRNGNKMMAVDVSAMANVTLSPPRVLFEATYAFGTGITIANYDVTRDGQRFLMVKNESGAGRLNIILNWFEDLARVAPQAGKPGS